MDAVIPTVSMIDVSLILNAVVAVSIGLGAIFAVIQLRELARERKTELVISLFSQYISQLAEPYSVLFSEEFADVAEMEKKCSFAGLFKLASYYEAVGLMVKRELVDVQLVMDYLPIADVWEKMKPWALRYREKTKHPSYWEYFEYLANRTKQYDSGIISEGVIAG